MANVDASEDEADPKPQNILPSPDSILSYQPPGPPRERRLRRVGKIGRRLLIWAAIAPAIIYSPDVYRGLKLFVHRQQMTRYHPPAGQVVCEETAAWAGFRGAFHSAAAQPTCLEDAVRMMPVDDSEQTVGNGWPTVFLHERTTPGGITRLVRVERRSPLYRESWDAPVAFDITLVVPRALPFLAWRGQTQSHGEVVPQVFADAPAKVAVRIFAGSPDPADASHFTFAYTADGEAGIIDGYLRDPPAGQAEPTVELKRRE